MPVDAGTSSSLETVLPVLNMPLNRLSLKQEAWARRDIEASYEQLLEARNLEHSFRYARVLLSKARLRAEVFLQQN